MSAAEIFGYCSMVTMIVPIVFGTITFSKSPFPIRWHTGFLIYSLCSTIISLKLARMSIPNHSLSHIYVVIKGITYFSIFTYFLPNYRKNLSRFLIILLVIFTCESIYTNGGIDRYPTIPNIFTSVLLVILAIMFIQKRILGTTFHESGYIFTWICISIIISESISVSVQAVTNYLLDTERYSFLRKIYAVKNLAFFISTLTLGYGYFRHYRQRGRMNMETKV